MTKKKINIWQYFIPTLIVISFLARVLFVVFYRDVHIDNEWGVLLDSLIKDKTYSYYKFYNEPIPSAYMPPLYVFFLYFIKIITSFEKTSFVNSIIFLQIIFGNMQKGKYLITGCAGFIGSQLVKNFWHSVLGITTCSILRHEQKSTKLSKVVLLCSEEIT